MNSAESLRQGAWCALEQAGLLREQQAEAAKLDAAIAANLKELGHGG